MMVIIRLLVTLYASIFGQRTHYRERDELSRYKEVIGYSVADVCLGLPDTPVPQKGC